eukprot:2158223-Rhodomonas_salina.2
MAIAYDAQTWALYGARHRLPRYVSTGHRVGRQRSYLVQGHLEPALAPVLAVARLHFQEMQPHDGRRV